MPSQPDLILSMSHFWPPRSSTPPRISLSPLTEYVNVATARIPELENLTGRDVQLLDKVIKRAGPDATTFLNVFKAYNEVLAEEGLDSNEVIYYGKLLKLGTLKGQNWTDKWKTVKEQYGYTRSSEPTRSFLPQPGMLRGGNGGRTSSSIPGPYFDQRDGNLDPEDEQSEAETNGVDITEPPRYHHPPRRNTKFPLRAVSPAYTEHSTDLSSFALLSAPPRTRGYHQTPSGITEEVGNEGVEEVERVPSSTPPSYSAAVRNSEKNDSVRRLLTLAGRYATAHNTVTPRLASTTGDTLRRSRQGREDKERRANNDDAWKKIQEERDEEDADKIYQENLLIKYISRWTGSCRHMAEVEQQVKAARETYERGVILQCWHVQMRARQASNWKADTKFLVVFLRNWQYKWKERQQAERRRRIRELSQLVKQKHAVSTRESVFRSWRSAYLINCSTKEYRKRRLARCFMKWKTVVDCAYELSQHAEQFQLSRIADQRNRYFVRWQRNARNIIHLNYCANQFLSIVHARLVVEVFKTWENRSAHLRAASNRYEVCLRRRSWGKFVTSFHRVQAIKAKGDSIIVRREKILLFATFAIWKERFLAERSAAAYRNALKRKVLRTWQQRVQQHTEDEVVKADGFYQKKSISTAAAALIIWSRGVLAHRKMIDHAEQMYNRNLLRQQLNWLQYHVASHRQNQMLSRRYDLIRMWRSLRFCAEQRMLTRKSNGLMMKLQKRVLRSNFLSWKGHVQAIQYREKLCQQHYERIMQAGVFRHVLNVWQKRRDNQKLLDSYLQLKHEEILTRYSLEWLRKYRYNQKVKQLAERWKRTDELTLKRFVFRCWREQHILNRLNGIATTVEEITARNLVCKGFAIWVQRSMYLPAYRLRKQATCRAYFHQWHAMLPAAQKARRHYLTILFKRWQQKFHQRMAAKASNRARYLRISANPQPLSSGLGYQTSQRTGGDDSMAGNQEEESDHEINSLMKRTGPSISGFLASRVVERGRTSLVGGSTVGSELRQLLNQDMRKKMEEKTDSEAENGREKWSRKTVSRVDIRSDKGDPTNRGKFWQDLRNIRSGSRPPSDAGTMSTHR